MGSLAAAVRNAMLEALGRNVAYQKAAFWVQLHTGAPGAAGTSNVAANTTRKQVTFAAAASGSMSNSADVEWTSVPAAETYSHVSFWDASTAGTFEGDDDLSATATFAIGDTFRIASGQLTLSLT